MPWEQGGFHWLHYIALLAIINVGLILPIATGGRIASVGPVPLPKAGTITPPPRPFVYVPSHAPLHVAPPVTGKPPTFSITPGAVPQVYNIVTGDTHVNLSQAINQAAAYYGFSAPGFAALMGVESGINQYAPHTPIAAWDRCDWSGGLTQINVCTAASLGIGDGSTSRANIDYVFNYEQADPIRDVWLSARLVARMKHNVCFDFPILYAAWNEGDGYGCGSYLYSNPQNAITQNAVRIYGGWWNVVWTYHVRYVNPTPPKPPKPVHHYKFPKRFYEQHRRSHHLKPISPYYHHKLAFAPSVWWTVQNKHGREVLGGILRHEQFNRRRQVMTTSYQCGKIFTWPTHHGWPAKVHRHRCIK